MTVYQLFHDKLQEKTLYSLQCDVIFSYILLAECLGDKGVCQKLYRILFTPWTCETAIHVLVLIEKVKIGKLLGEMLELGNYLCCVSALSASGVVEGLDSTLGCLIGMLAPAVASYVISGKSFVSSSLKRLGWFCQL